MPVEIRELYIKAVIDTGKASAPAQLPGETSPAPATTDPNQQQDDLIAVCVEKVLEVLKNRQER
ncbi:hypothetical protein DVR12_24145 [Chitinophaga silvatica]|uniref:Uncharacterized protein n=1 Tax=Chitinophaga silvatica TaxID=2282649 RepID=A0A3E1Y3R7_9BACT|nr:DUF5908 family protein [Chitinophaga silvatica]RFS19325.1 hypothetical protein DVR12_24145 [Chitinophaga silvatica]